MSSFYQDVLRGLLSRKNRQFWCERMPKNCSEAQGHCRQIGNDEAAWWFGRAADLLQKHQVIRGRLAWHLACLSMTKDDWHSVWLLSRTIR